MSRRAVRTGVIGLGVAIATLVLAAPPALAQHGGRASRGASSRTGSAQRSGSAAQRAPSGAMMRSAPSTYRSAGAYAAVAGRARPIGSRQTGIAVARSMGPSTYGRVMTSRPYYAFRPRFSLGIGLSVGYPVAFPYWYSGYYYPYASSAYYPGYGSGYYGSSYYGSGGSTVYGSSYARSGGLSFDITPIDAALFIDGKYVGTVEDFAPTEAPLTLSTGRHHVDVRAQGYQTMSFDISVVPGQVIPYQGTMSLIR